MRVLLSLGPWLRGTPWQGTDADLLITLEAWLTLRRAIKEEDFQAALGQFLTDLARIFPGQPQGGQGAVAHGSLVYGLHDLPLNLEVSQHGIVVTTPMYQTRRNT